MGWRCGLWRVSPAVALTAIGITDVLLPSGEVVSGLLVIAPLLATIVALGPVGTAVYGVLAVVTAILAGIQDQAYAPERLSAQLTRLVTVAATSAMAVILCRFRDRQERRLVRMARVAEVAQRAILVPVPDRLGPARVAVHYESATSDALVGGDLYAMVLTQYGLRVLVGDVRGKGLEAVRMAVQVLAAFWERASDHPDLAVLMDWLDRAVARCAGDEEEFVTAVLVQITDHGTASIANAGHPWPYLVHAGHAALVAPGCARAPLGLGGSTRVSTVSLAAGDRLLLYTDGLTEARDPVRRSFLPESTVRTALTTGAGVGDTLAALQDRVLTWSGGVLHDDLALVLIEYRPPTAPPGAPLAEALPPPQREG